MGRVSAVKLAFETTLSTKSYKDRIERAKASGYKVTLLFFWLREVELAKERVKTRVLEGGHNIDEEVIDLRYRRGIVNLFDLFLPLVDEALIIDNSEGVPVEVAEKLQNEKLSILNRNLSSKLYEQYESGK